MGLPKQYARDDGPESGVMYQISSAPCAVLTVPEVVDH
jgi:hypothetical protein